MEDHIEARNYKRYGVPGGWYAWGRFHDRFDINKEPNEANRFGWVVEIDPYDPTALPIKRTALGRFKHQGGTTIINKDDRLAIYSGDDQPFDYLYKYVSHGRVDLYNRANNAHILDEGILFVAKFHDDGRLEWLLLVWGAGPLTEGNDFRSQADVLIETRRTADLLGATPMDRPEDVEPHPLTHKVYVMLTNNSRRKPEQVDAANPRAKNLFGHVIELTPRTAIMLRLVANVCTDALSQSFPGHVCGLNPDVQYDAMCDCMTAEATLSPGKRSDPTLTVDRHM